MRQAAHALSCWFWVPAKEPPGGQGCAARRHMAMYSIFWVFMKGLAVIIELLGDADPFGSDLMMLGFSCGF